MSTWGWIIIVFAVSVAYWAGFVTSGVCNDRRIERGEKLRDAVARAIIALDVYADERCSEILGILTEWRNNP